MTLVENFDYLSDFITQKSVLVYPLYPERSQLGKVSCAEMPFNSNYLLTKTEDIKSGLITISLEEAQSENHSNNPENETVLFVKNTENKKISLGVSVPEESIENLVTACAYKQMENVFIGLGQGGFEYQITSNDIPPYSGEFRLEFDEDEGNKTIMRMICLKNEYNQVIISKIFMQEPGDEQRLIAYLMDDKVSVPVPEGSTKEETIRNFVSAAQTFEIMADACTHSSDIVNTPQLGFA